MKIYYSPGACALASQIALREAGMKFDMVRVDLKAKTIEGGGDYKKINPRGYVPALQMDDGEVLTEGAVILQWIADQVPAKNLIPKFGTKERYHAMEWLNFVATEMHKSIGGLFSSQLLSEEAKKAVHDKIQLRLAALDAHLQKNAFMTGPAFSVVDAYVYNIIRWTVPLKVDMTAHKAIMGLMEKLNQRPCVREAVEAEGQKV